MCIISYIFYFLFSSSSTKHATFITLTTLLIFVFWQCYDFLARVAQQTTKMLTLGYLLHRFPPSISDLSTTNLVYIKNQIVTCTIPTCYLAITNIFLFYYQYVASFIPVRNKMSTIYYPFPFY